MSNPYPSMAGWTQPNADAQHHQQQYPPQQQQYAAQQAYPPAGYPAAAPVSQYPSAAAAGPSSSQQQSMQAPPAGYPSAAAQQQHWQTSTSSTCLNAQQQFHQQYPTQTDYAQHMQQQEEGAGGADGSRGLGTALLGAGHTVSKVGLAMRHVAHPVQGLKYHTVDKVKRKLKGKVCQMVDKVMP